MKKGFVRSGVLLLLAMLVLAACSSGNGGNGGNSANSGGNSGNSGGNASSPQNESASSGDVEGNVSLSFWTLFSGGDGENMQAMVDQFNQEHPNIQVKNTMLEWGEYYTKLITAVGNGNGPDIGISHTSRLPDLYDQGVVTELDDAAAAAGVDWSSYNQNILESTVYDGKHYAVPLDTHPMIMYYNKKLLKDAGLLGDDGKPVFENTGDGFLAFMSELKAKLPQNVTPFALPSTNDDPFRFWWAIYSQQGGNDVISDDLTKAEVDTEKAVNAAKYIQDLFTNGYIKKNDPDALKNFQSGTAAITLTGVWATGTLEATEGLEFGAMPIPAIYSQVEATWGDSHTIILPVTKKEDENKRKAAVIFANWLAEHGEIWAKAGHIPANNKAIEKPEFKALPARTDYANVASTVKFFKHSTKSWQIRDLALFKYLNEVWAGKMTPEDAVTNMTPEIQKVLDE